MATMWYFTKYYVIIFAYIKSNYFCIHIKCNHFCIHIKCNQDIPKKIYKEVG